MKKRSSLIILGILILLAGFAIYTYKNKGKASTIDADARNFKYADTAAITKIFIADKEGVQSTLLRTKNGWVVNNKYPCRKDAILNLLEAIKNVEVKMPVPKSAKETVLKIMSSMAVKVELYAGDELVKQYYIGHETTDSEGSYALLTNLETGENYADPYIVFIPGFQGFLMPRFISKEGEWRDRVVMNFIPPQIKQVRLENIEQPDSSFTLELLSTTSFKLKDAHNQEVAFDVNKVKQYLAYFQNVSYEALFTGRAKKLEDSLSALKPFAIMKVSTSDLNIHEYKFYYKQPPSIIPEKGIVFKHDPDRLYLRFDHDREWALIQFYTFGKLLVNTRYFTQPDVKK